MRQPLLILGASVRSAAQSAIRAGFSPIAADVFADADLTSICPTTKITNYPDELEVVARQTPACPWIYTGALENHPQLVDRISESRPLLGNSGEILREVRNPLEFAEALSAEGINVPQVRREQDPPQSGDWLIKPVSSAGGLKIKRFITSEQSGSLVDRNSAIYYQEFITGVSRSAIYVAARGQAVLLGAAQQFCHVNWLRSPGFVYAGSFGPLLLSTNEEERLRRIGSCMAKRFDLTGLFGIDFVFSDNEFWPIELNPRYTASVEVIERATSTCALAHHVSACRDGVLPQHIPLVADTTIFGKAIKYANSDLQITTAAVDFAFIRNHASIWPSYADIPAPETSIAAGKPVMTLLASGESLDELQRNLKDLWDQFEQRLA